MGYRRKAKNIVLEFEGEEYEGFEVKIKSLPVAEFLRLSTLFEGEDTGDEKSITEMLKILSKSVVTWNLEDEDGNPVPPTYVNLIAQDIDFMMSIIGAWVNAISGVPDSLGKDSNSGETSLEHTLTMEPTA